MGYGSTTAVFLLSPTAEKERSRHMPSDLNQALKAEIERLAKKLIRAETKSMKSASARHRSDIAGLKRTVKDLEKHRTPRKAREPAHGRSTISEARLRGSLLSRKTLETPRATRTFCRRLRVSQPSLTAVLVGVHQITIYNWEQGKSRPRKEQLAALVAVRSLGKREAQTRLEMLKTKTG